MGSVLRLTLDADSLDALAREVGVTIQTKQIARFPVEYRTAIEDFIRRQHLTGRLSVDFSQGHGGVLTWESSR